VFLHTVGSAGHVVHSGPSGHEMSMHYFSCSGGTSAVFIKSAPGHVMPNLCFLHLVGSMGHVLHSDVCGA
jgi:hypothetical protein